MCVMIETPTALTHEADPWLQPFLHDFDTCHSQYGFNQWIHRDCQPSIEGRIDADNTGL